MIPLQYDGYTTACQPIWDSANARLSLCATPYFALIPAIIILGIAIDAAIGRFLWRWSPKWTQPFVAEKVDNKQDLPFPTRHRSWGWAIILSIPSVIALASEATQLIVDGVGATAVILLVSWFLAIFVIILKRPQTCLTGMFAYYLATLSMELTFVVNRHLSGAPPTIAAHWMSIGASITSLLILLLMPFRDPLLPSDDIGPVGATPSAEYRSPEDKLRVWQFLTVYWMAPLMSIGRKRQLNEADIWFLPFQFQHKRLHEKFRQLRGSVLCRLLRANGIDISIVGAIAIVQLICDFSTPVLLQQLLQAMQDPEAPRRIPLTYALITLTLRLVAAQAQVLDLWYGRRCYERSRGEMIMMVYEKALSRKNIFGPGADEKLKGDEEEQNGKPANGSSSEHATSATKRQKLWDFFTRPKNDKKAKSKESASMGKIFNLLRGDVYEVAQRFWEVDILVDKPVGLVIAVVLVWQLFGPSCFLGILALLVGQGVNVIIARILLSWERVRRSSTDSRLQVTSQFVEAIRHLRWYGWQNHWLKQVMDARQKELNLRIITGLWNALIRFINSFASGVFPVIALYAYTLLAGNPLRIDIIFPALQLFTMLENRLREVPNLITTLINAAIAIGRIEDFMAESDKEKVGVDQPTDDLSLELKSCSFAWPAKASPVLSDLNVTISQGLTVVYGKVGSGKTAFLQALLGELDKLSGDSRVPNEMVGYCAQTPWLQSMSIRENILFSSPYEPQRYKRVLEACALVPDLRNFKHGDLSFIGENGIGLSGGQKARVALARALYSPARIVMLDDPLSALDHNTAETIVQKCFASSLMEGRIVVLVTHRTWLVQHLADQVIEIEDGKATVQGRGDLLNPIEGDEAASSNGHSREIDDEPEMAEDTSGVVPDKFIEEEYRAEWGVQARVYWSYIRAGKLKWWTVLVIVLSIYRLVAVAQSWFLKEWGEAYDQLRVAIGSFWVQGRTGLSDTFYVPPMPLAASPDRFHFIRNPLDDLPPPLEDVRPWLLTFFLIATSQAITLLAAQLLMLVIVYYASKNLFREVMVKVSHATFRFFDVTPVGRLMNRLTSDIGVVDGNISMQFQFMAFSAITWVSSIVVIASVTPTFLVFSAALTGAFVLIFLRFLPTSQSLRRLEMVSLSPLLSNFGELLNGLTTVRAFHAEIQFQNRVIEVVDKFQGMDHFYWSLQSWLMFRFESLSAVSTFCLTVLALYTRVSAGLVAFVLIAANNFVSSTHALCRLYGQLQMDFVSVERVDELRHVEQEPAGAIEPPAAWPKFGGDVVFEDVTIRYAPHLDPSLNKITLRIPGGSTTAVLGRTGSGKSTLALSLLGVVRAETGRILIDNIDIAEVSMQALRTRVTFVAQDPVLFPGSIRLNLDPTEEYSDSECAEVLERVCSRHAWTLQTHVEAGGRNLSQGQRQLIGLTRAVLRRSAIVILDEATASIDHETSLEMQKIIREEMQQSTVITIAHRLEAINNADWFVRLDQGQVTEQGPVHR